MTLGQAQVQTLGSVGMALALVTLIHLEASLNLKAECLYLQASDSKRHRMVRLEHGLELESKDRFKRTFVNFETQSIYVYIKSIMNVLTTFNMDYTVNHLINRGLY